MPLTREKAVGYDADLMVFKFTMRNGEQIVPCQISKAALCDLAGRWRGGAARDLAAEFETHRELGPNSSTKHQHPNSSTKHPMRKRGWSALDVWSNCSDADVWSNCSD